MVGRVVIQCLSKRQAFHLRNTFPILNHIRRGLRFQKILGTVVPPHLPSSALHTVVPSLRVRTTVALVPEIHTPLPNKGC
jgi:hypothetical protein